ncbi:DUF4225 domain-containing protein [Pseudomonas sp. V98_8]|uniref:DUF4225 domain-containing protein n=1 Tax=Pseudomonas sp. V98_8 TaxID=3044228 RepID=UPI00249ED95E|nr:DUF4225 domain-containing protein [Pseudomonas sp. V98_8]MDI3393766.1 DUF4225 domain-containing protein [Pseudomonas sp. V98_8]
MNETSCDIHDVTRAASDLVAVGSSVGMAHIPDGFARLRFGSIISAYVDEIIQAVDEGVISAWQAVQDITAEYEDLSSKARFYLQNGVGVVGGVMQIRTGVLVIGGSGGLGAVPGGLMVGHGANNIYEGLGNIYNGPGVPSVLGPVRQLYQTALRDEGRGDITYYSLDLLLSSYGVLRQVQKPGVFELFRYDPLNYEVAYQQSGKLALAFEALVDFFTLSAIVEKGVSPRGE